MVETAAARVDWAMAEALAFGTLVLHRWSPPSSPGATAETAAAGPAGADAADAPALGLNYGHYGG